ncbi:glycine betaine ABC transporter substrate-binding protein [Frateuria defendens]|uniref:glycine betaine ABC transporter substrate-binding protein n=1 Tax=Frateuria defendens TaxID=2219559 RepID=UPI0009E5C823|nr:glycine betaine ABC transporter substrate-binding protein [Frateuria defendens]
MSAPIRLGHIDLSFHAASAAVVQAILEDRGHQVVVSSAPHEAMFQHFGAHEVDMLVSAWLPASHEAYLAPHLERTIKLGVLYQPFCLWGVPDYVPLERVGSVSDLLKPEVLARMERRIQGINPGAGISRFSQAIVREYGLDAAGYHFEPGSEADCFDGFERAVAERRWRVLPLWQPQYLHHRYRIRPLDEPRGLLGGVDQATLIMRKELEPVLAPELVAMLAGLQLGNAAVTELDYRIRVEGIAPLAAARAWLAKRAACP